MLPTWRSSGNRRDNDETNVFSRMTAKNVNQRYQDRRKSFWDYKYENDAKL